MLAGPDHGGQTDFETLGCAIDRGDAVKFHFAHGAKARGLYHIQRLSDCSAFPPTSRAAASASHLVAAAPSLIPHATENAVAVPCLVVVAALSEGTTRTSDGTQ